MFWVDDDRFGFVVAKEYVIDAGARTIDWPPPVIDTGTQAIDKAPRLIDRVKDRIDFGLSFTFSMNYENL